MKGISCRAMGLKKKKKCDVVSFQLFLSSRMSTACSPTFFLFSVISYKPSGRRFVSFHNASEKKYSTVLSFGSGGMNDTQELDGGKTTHFFSSSFFAENSHIEVLESLISNIKIILNKMEYGNNRHYP